MKTQKVTNTNLLLLAIISLFFTNCNEKVTTGFANINETSIYYELKGEGTPLVFMHGFALDLRHWDNQFEKLSKDFSVLRYDFRGFGKSQMPDTLKPYSHVNDLKALLDYLKIDKVVLIGHSMGGLPAFEFTYNSQDRVKALVFAEGAASIQGFNNQPGSKEIGDMFGEVFKIGRNIGVEDGKEALIAAGVSLSAVNNPVSSEKFQQMLADYSGWHWTNKDPKKNYKRVKFEDLSKLRTPVLLINGELSYDHYKQTMQKMHKYLPNSKLVVLNNSGHMLSLENPGQFNEELRTFLKENNIK